MELNIYSIEGGFATKISGTGLFESVTKKARIKSTFGQRYSDLQYDRNANALILNSNPLDWITNNGDPSKNDSLLPLRHRDQLTKRLEPYVRKTAVMCLAKLYNTTPGLVNENGFINTLTTLLNDCNTLVVANTLASLTEISTLSVENLIKIRWKVLKRILLALN